MELPPGEDPMTKLAVKTFSNALVDADLSRLTESPIEVADAAIEAILSEAEASQRNIFAKLAVALRVANDRKIYIRHVDPYGEPFKSMDSWIKAMYPDTWRYARDAFAAAVAMPEVPIEDIADMKRCNAVLLSDPGISPMTRRDPEIIEAAKTETEKEFIAHLNSKHQHIERPETLKITYPAGDMGQVKKYLRWVAQKADLADLEDYASALLFLAINENGEHEA
jgi:hypothetical protein